MEFNRKKYMMIKVELNEDQQENIRMHLIDHGILTPYEGLPQDEAYEFVSEAVDSAINHATYS